MNWDLLPGEMLIYEGKASHLFFGKKVIQAVVLIVLAVLILVYAKPLDSFVKFPLTKYVSIVLFLGALLLLARVEMLRNKERIALTNRRILIMRKDEETNKTKLEAIPLDKLIRVSVYQTFLQRMLNTGEIVFQLPGETHTFEHIRKPKELERAVYNVLEGKSSYSTSYEEMQYQQ